MAELVGGAAYGNTRGPQCAMCGQFTDPLSSIHVRFTEAQQLAHQFRQAGAPLCPDCIPLAMAAYHGYQSWRGGDANIAIEEILNITPFMRLVSSGGTPAINFPTPTSSGLLWDLIPMLAAGYNARGYGDTLWLAELLRAIVNGDDPRATKHGETLLMRLTSLSDDWDFGVINRCQTAQEVFAKKSPYEAAARILISAGADIEARNSIGNTAVLQAANGGGEYGRAMALALALKLGGDPYAKDQCGKNAFDIARDREAKVLEIWQSAQNAVLNPPPQGPTADAKFGKAAQTKAQSSAATRSELMRQVAQVFHPLAQGRRPGDEGVD